MNYDLMLKEMNPSVIHVYDSYSEEFERDFASDDELRSVWPGAEIVSLEENEDGSVTIYC